MKFAASIFLPLTFQIIGIQPFCLPFGDASGVCQGSGEPGTWGVSATELPTDFTFTGQREAAEIGLKYYVARWYDSEIGHFIQADTVMSNAENPKAWNIYAYVYYNPIKYVDPSGHTGFLPNKNVLLTDTGVFRGFAGDLITLPEIITSSTTTNSGEFIGEISVNFKNSTITGAVTCEDAFSASLDAMSLSGDIVILIMLLDDALGPIAWLDELIGVPYSIVVESAEIGQVVLSGTELADGLYDALFEGDYDNLNDALQDMSIDQIFDMIKESEFISDVGQAIPVLGGVFSLSDILENCEIDIEYKRNK